MIVSFGSLNADFIFEMERPPQPGETLSARGLRMEPGGKGANQAVAAARAGAAVAMVGAVGRDGLAEIALGHMAPAGVDVTRVASVDAATGCASIVVDDAGRNQIVVAAGANGFARADQLADEDLRPGDRILLQMGVPGAEVAAMVARARRCGAFSILNLAPATEIDPAALAACGLLVVNESEAATVAGRLGCSADSASLARALGTGVLRSLGGDGAEATTAEGSCRVPALPIIPVDTTAAGDCLIGVLAAGLAEGRGFEAALRRATVAAALCCGRRGSQSSLPWREEIDRAGG